MSKVVEEINYNGEASISYIKKVFDSQEKVISEKLICFKSSKVKYKDNKEYILIYDSNGKLVSDAFRFINIEKIHLSPNTKDMYVVPLKLLFSFCEIFNKSFRNLNKEDINQFKTFLFGISQIGNNVEFKLKTRRSPETINNYFTIYRSFLCYVGEENSIFHKKNVINSFKGTRGLLGHTEKEVKFKYSVNEKVVKQDVVPMYISVDQFKDILLYIRRNLTIREEIIVRLMFQTGMRIGEVLGITLEDIATDPEEYNYKEIDDIGRINILNRLSDKKYQLAKNCFIPKSEEEYNTKYYAENLIQYVTPEIALLLLIEKYIEDSHGEMTSTKRKNYLEYAAADLINSEQTYLENGNYYLFINKDGKPLSQSGWSKILRGIFRAVGLKVDKNIRRHNLSHRFRHGFAMYLIQYKSYNEVQVRNALRQRSLSSVSFYFNPTVDDIYEANKSAGESLHKLIPELLLLEE